MKLLLSVLLLTVISLVNTACVSRTVTTEKGFGEESTENKLIWIWEKEFRQPQY